jgi:hypothetical protein
VVTPKSSWQHETAGPQYVVTLQSPCVLWNINYRLMACRGSSSLCRPTAETFKIFLSSFRVIWRTQLSVSGCECWTWCVLGRRPNLTACLIKSLRILTRVQLSAALTSCMDYSPPWEASSSSATQEIPHILWNQNVHYSVNKSSLLVLFWARLIHSTPSQLACLTFWRRNFYFILAHPVYKMLIIQEPNTLELRNKLHFEEEKT